MYTCSETTVPCINNASCDHYRDPSNPYPGDDNAILFELTPYLESAGFHDPLSKVIETGKCDVHVWSVVGWSPTRSSSFFFGKVTACVALLCCLFDLACFFSPSFSISH